MLGFSLVAPNAATLALLAAAEVIIQVQVRLEEKHLLGLHGSAYDPLEGQGLVARAEEALADAGEVGRVGPVAVAACVA